MTEAEKYELFQRTLIMARQEQGLTQTEVASRLGKPQSFVSKYESGERRLDVVELCDLCVALSVNPHDILDVFTPQLTSSQSVLRRWNISETDLTELVEQNPSLRGVLLGYVAEKKFHDAFLGHSDITERVKDDDHNRKKKGDRRIIYKGKTLLIEVKSLQTKLVKRIGPDQWSGKAQVDASDRRKVKFPDGTELDTTLLLRGEFDLLAVNCFAFGEQEWRFVFAKNSDLPCSSFKKYTDEQARQLIASLIEVSWPPMPPFTDNPFSLLDDLASHPIGNTKIVEVEGATEAKEAVVEVRPKV